MKLFGTDGLRGRAGEFPLDARSAHLVGEEVGKRAGAGATVVLGGDTRESTPALLSRLAAGLSLSGCEIAPAGVIPTPAIAELVLALSAGAGISVSASHNPYQDNGIKIFGPDGSKWPDSEEERLEASLLASRSAAKKGGGEDEHPHPDLPAARYARRDLRSRPALKSAGGTPPGPPAEGEGAEKLAEIYLSRLAAHLPVRVEGLAVVVDTGNGAAFRVGPEALRRAGARVTAIADRPDGRNINERCGALHPEGMAAKTREIAAAMGVAFDGDADRAIFSDETGRVLDGDDVLWIIARSWKNKGLLKGGVVGTVMSNFGLEAGLAREGISFSRAPVGDRNVARVMEQSGAAIGGETSGHVLLPFSPAGDGIQTALLLASILSESREPLSRLATLEKTPQILRNVHVARRVAIEGIAGLSRAIARAEQALDRRGRVYLRYSGTEPLLRILVEGSERETVVSVADELEAVARKELS